VIDYTTNILDEIGLQAVQTRLCEG